VPSAPADLKAVVSAQNKILVTWLAPTEPNGVLVAYTLYTGLLEDGKEVTFFFFFFTSNDKFPMKLNMRSFLLLEF
jgi:hypothetical protein